MLACHAAELMKRTVDGIQEGGYNRKSDVAATSSVILLCHM
jgi:hypothetical protein